MISLFSKFILWLNGYVEKPAMYGLYHLSFVFALIVLCVIYYVIAKKYKSANFYKNTVLVCWIILVILEIIKEIAVGYFVDADGIAHFNYNYIYFPYQLCSLPFYVLPFIVFVKNEKIKEYFVIPTVSFILLGGLLLVLIPGGFKEVRYINFHTMAHHSIQVFSSFVCILWYKKDISFKNYWKCIPMLVVGMILSIILNSCIYKFNGVSVQLWNLSPYVVFDLDILESIRGAIGYVPYVFLYFVLVLVFSLLVYVPIIIIRKIKKDY